MSKTNPGNFFEDFAIGQVIEHACKPCKGATTRRGAEQCVALTGLGICLPFCPLGCAQGY